MERVGHDIKVALQHGCPCHGEPSGAIQILRHGSRATTAEKRPGDNATTRAPTRRTVLRRGLMALAAAVMWPVRAVASTTPKKVLILGFDGMDPQLLEDLLEHGQLPNLQRLRQQGGLHRLATSMPPQSPVAWSNFITGMNPGGHGIFDFIHRDPVTMLPYLSTSQATPAQRTIRLGNWVIPLSKGKVELLRQGTAFWEVLEAHGVPTTVLKIPANFPPVGVPSRTLSGMGTPDLAGTYGTFAYFTDQPWPAEKAVTGGRVHQVTVKDYAVHSRLPGPPNPFRVGQLETGVDFTVYIDPEHAVGKIVLQDQAILLRQGEWSDWVRVTFSLLPPWQRATGICRFFLRAVRPHFQLYATPVNIDPSAPALPLSTPPAYVQELYQELGFFYTQGIPEDTKALASDVLSDGEFLQQASLVQEEHRKLLTYELRRFKSGVLFAYFGGVDLLSHMFWRTMDPRHPAHDPATKHAGVIASVYREMEAVLGEALRSVDANTTLIVMSDHGFAPYYRGVHVNAWLQQQGYLRVIDPHKQDDSEFLDNVDWRATRAYALGLNGLYVNQRQREARGIVTPGPAKAALIEELAQKLLQIRDPQNGQPVVARVYRASDIYQGPYVQQAPDLLIGYHRGYRASWETALGKVPTTLLQDNTEKWSGDHCMAAELVPGVLLSNKPIRTTQPALIDLAPTILAEFGVPVHPQMIGKSVF